MAFEHRIIADKKEWNTFIGQYGEWSLFQSYEWGEVAQKSNTKIVRLGFYADGRLIALALVEKVMARRGTFLQSRQGPVLIPEPNAQQLLHYWKFISQTLVSHAKQEKALFVRISPMVTADSESAKIVIRLGFRPAPIHAMNAEHCWVLDIDKSLEEILAGMRKTTRYLVRQSEKSGVEVKIASDMSEFLHLYHETSTRQHFVPHTGIAEEFSIFSETGHTLLLLGYHEKILLSAALIIFFGKQAIYHHGASIPSKIPVSYAIQWRAIQEAKKRGCALYNFWGIAEESNARHPWHGLTLFKKGFGGHEMEFMHASDLPISPLYMIPYTVETIRKIRKGY